MRPRARSVVALALGLSLSSSGCAFFNFLGRVAERSAENVSARLEARGRAVAEPLIEAGEIWRETLAHPLASEGFRPQDEYLLGRQVSAQLLQRYPHRRWDLVETEAGIVAGPRLSYLQILAQIVLEGARLSQPGAEGTQLRERFPTALRVAVVESEAPDAFAAPGGFVILSTGMLSLAQDEEELAAVLAHELAHVTLAHGLAAVDQGRHGAALGKLIEGVEAGRSALKGRPSELSEAVAALAGDIAQRLEAGYAPEWELAADQRAALTLEALGYDPQGLVEVIARIPPGDDLEGHSRSHPPPARRLKALRASLGERAPPPGVGVRAARFRQVMEGATGR